MDEGEDEEEADAVHKPERMYIKSSARAKIYFGR